MVTIVMRDVEMIYLRTLWRCAIDGMHDECTGWSAGGDKLNIGGGHGPVGVVEWRMDDHYIR